MVIDDAEARDAELLRIARQRTNRVRWIVLGTVISGCIVAGGLGWAADGRDTHRAGHAGNGPIWLFLLVVGLPAILTVLTFFFIVRLQRRGNRWLPGPIRLGGVDRATRRRVGRYVRRGELPPDEPDRGLALEYAQALNRTRWQLATVPVVLLGNIPNLLDHRSSVWLFGGIAVYLLFLMGWIYQLRMFRRLRRIVTAADSTT